MYMCQVSEPFKMLKEFSITNSKTSLNLNSLPFVQSELIKIVVRILVGFYY